MPFLHDSSCEANSNTQGLCLCGTRIGIKSSYKMPEALEDMDFIYRAKIKSLESERDTLKAYAENLLWNLAGCDTIAMGYGDGKFDESMALPALHSVNRLAKDRDKWKALAEGLAKALKGQIQMRDMKKPTKLDEEISWRDNDDLAAKWTTYALASYESAVKEKGGAE